MVTELNCSLDLSVNPATHAGTSTCIKPCNSVRKTPSRRRAFSVCKQLWSRSRRWAYFLSMKRVKHEAPGPQETCSIPGRTRTELRSSGTAQLRKALHQPARPLAVCHKLGSALRVAVHLRCIDVHGKRRTRVALPCPTSDRVPGRQYCAGTRSLPSSRRYLDWLLSCLKCILVLTLSIPQT